MGSGKNSWDQRNSNLAHLVLLCRRGWLVPVEFRSWLHWQSTTYWAPWDRFPRVTQSRLVSGFRLLVLERCLPFAPVSLILILRLVASRLRLQLCGSEGLPRRLHLVGLSFRSWLVSLLVLLEKASKLRLRLRGPEGIPRRIRRGGLSLRSLLRVPPSSSVRRVASRLCF